MTEALPLDKVRFFVADDQDARRSAPWYLHGHGESLYLGPSVLGGALKLSLHPPRSGADGKDTQYGTTRPYIERARKLGFDKFPRIARWIRPQPKPGDIRFIGSISFPTDFLLLQKAPPTNGKKRIALPMAPSGQALEVSLFVTASDDQSFHSDFTAYGRTPFASAQVREDEVFWLTARHVPFDPGLLNGFAEKLSHSTPLTGAPAPGQSVDEAHAILLRDLPKDGRGFHLMEVSGLTVTRLA